MFVRRDEPKTFHSKKKNIDKPRLGRASYRPTSSLHNNVVSPQQFQFNRLSLLKKNYLDRMFSRFRDCSKALRHFWAHSVYRRCRTAPAPFQQLSAWAFDRTHVGQLWVRLALKQPQQVNKMAEFSPFVQQAQQCGRSEFSHPRSPSTQTCLAGLKNETGP